MTETITKIRLKIKTPHPGQRRVIDEAKRFNVLQCGRRFGKTKLGIERAIDGVIHLWPVAWFAPTYKLLAEVWRELINIVAPLNPRINVQEKRIEIVGGGSIDCWSLDQPDAGRGRKYRRVIVDEAGIVRNLQEAWQEAIRPTLADYRGDAWFLGTPKGRNFFHRLFARGQNGDRDWASWRMPTVSNPTISKEEIESAKRDMPEAAFNQEFLGIPADDGGNPFGLDAIARQKRDGLAHGPPIAIGVDLARSQDWVVVCGLNTVGDVCLLERWQSDWGQTRRKVLDLIGKCPTLIDQTGVGDPIVEDMIRAGANAEGFKFSSTSKQMIMEGLAAAIQRGAITFPEGWLTSELSDFEYQFSAGGVKYSAPDGLHDDGVCALALAVHCKAVRRPMKTVGGNTYAPPPRSR